MKSIEFAEQYVGPIQDGAKTATVRVDECEEIEQGDRVRLVSETGQRFETARVTSTAETFVGGALHSIRALGAEYPAESTQALLDGLRHHYGPEIDGRTQCRVLCWELVEAGQIMMADGGRPGPLRWRLSEGPPEHCLVSETDQDPEEIAAGEFLDRVDPDRRTVADELAEQAADDPEADPLAGVETRGGYPIGTTPVASNPGSYLRTTAGAER